MGQADFTRPHPRRPTPDHRHRRRTVMRGAERRANHQAAGRKRQARRRVHPATNIRPFTTAGELETQSNPPQVNVRWSVRRPSGLLFGIVHRFVPLLEVENAPSLLRWSEHLGDLDRRRCRRRRDTKFLRNFIEDD